MKSVIILVVLCSAFCAIAYNPMKIRATRYSGTTVHENDIINIDWHSKWHMDKVRVLQTINRESNIRVNYTIKELSGKVKAYSDGVNFCDFDKWHRDGHVVKLIQKALHIPHTCPLEPGEYEVETKAIHMDLSFGYEDVDCDGAEIDIKLLSHDKPLLEGTWGILILDNQCHHWFSTDEL